MYNKSLTLYILWTSAILLMALGTHYLYIGVLWFGLTLTIVSSILFAVAIVLTAKAILDFILSKH